VPIGRPSPWLHASAARLLHAERVLWPGRWSYPADVDMALLHALEPVLRDLRSCGLPVPEVREAAWVTPDEEAPLMAYAMMWSPDGSGTGISVSLSDPETDRVATAADQVQEWVIEELWRVAPTNWPPCPGHPDNHPRVASTEHGVAAWVCPQDGAYASPIGSL